MPWHTPTRAARDWPNDPVGQAPWISTAKVVVPPRLAPFGAQTGRHSIGPCRAPFEGELQPDRKLYSV